MYIIHSAYVINNIWLFGYVLFSGVFCLLKFIQLENKGKYIYSFRNQNLSNKER